MGAVLHWMMFQRVFGYGTTRSQQVLDGIGHPSRLFDLPLSQLADLRLLHPKELQQLSAREKLMQETQLVLERARELGCTVLTPDSDGYPHRLKNIYSPPAVLYLLGSIEGLDEQPAIAMVGTRKCTAYGRAVAEDLTRQLVERGVAIISGMALGIDTVSHLAALKAGGRTVAVLGNGLDAIYPPANTELHGLILRNGGAVVSEFPPGEAPLPFHFPIRNRIISGLSMGVVVVEGTRHSGSLITAGHAVTQDRDVFAVPGEIYSPMSQATNWLVSQGATLVTGAEDILRQYPYVTFLPARDTQPEQISFDIPQATVYNGQKKPKASPREAVAPQPSPQRELPSYLSEGQRRVLSQLGAQPVTSDAIAMETGMTVAAILSALTQLELFGLVDTCAGRRFILKQ